MNIHAVLFDADGVIQKPSAHRRDAWRSVLGSDRDLDAFVAALFEAEVPALEGKSDFGKALASLLGEWECCGTVDDALRAWTMIEADAEIIGILRALRRSGVACHLATNQEPHRAAYMSETLGYAALFTREFYSCRGASLRASGAGDDDQMGDGWRIAATFARRKGRGGCAAARLKRNVSSITDGRVRTFENEPIAWFATQQGT